MDLSRFRKNPVLLYAHDREMLPVGKVHDLRVEGNELVGEVEFDEAEHSFGRMLADKYRRGFMNAFSISFRGLKKTKDAALRLPGQRGVTFTETELLEISAVPLPSHPDALAQRSVEDGLEIRTNPSFETQTPDDVDLEKIALALGLLKTASEGDILRKLQAQETERRNLATQVETLSADSTDTENRMAKLEATFTSKIQEVEQAKAELEQERRSLRATTLVDSALAQGKIVKGQAEHFRKLAESDFESTKALVDSMPAAQSLTDYATRGAGQGEDRSAWTFADWETKDPDGLGELRTADPERYLALVKAYTA